MAIAADTYKGEFCSEATAQGITSCPNPPLPLTAFAASPVQIGMTKTIAEALKQGKGESNARFWGKVFDHRLSWRETGVIDLSHTHNG